MHCNEAHECIPDIHGAPKKAAVVSSPITVHSGAHRSPSADPISFALFVRTMFKQLASPSRYTSPHIMSRHSSGANDHRHDLNSVC